MLHIAYSTLSKTGGHPVNEDFLGVSITPEKSDFILCDGLGGHGNGDVASYFVVEQMKHALESSFSVEESILKAQEKLLQKQTQENAKNSMKTTVACLEISNDIAKFAHVGDSRIYYFEKYKYIVRSQDHSVPQMLEESEVVVSGSGHGGNKRGGREPVSRQSSGALGGSGGAEDC